MDEVHETRVARDWLGPVLLFVLLLGVGLAGGRAMAAESDWRVRQPVPLRDAVVVYDKCDPEVTVARVSAGGAEDHVVDMAERTAKRIELREALADPDAVVSFCSARDDMPLPGEGDAYVVTLRRCDSGGVAALCVYADGTMWTNWVRTRLDGPDCPKATYMLDDGGRLYSLCAEITDGGEVRP